MKIVEITIGALFEDPDVADEHDQEASEEQFLEAVRKKIEPFVKGMQVRCLFPEDDGDIRVKMPTKSAQAAMIKGLVRRVLHDEFDTWACPLSASSEASAS